MKVQVFEQFHGGHYTTYIQHLLAPLLAQKHDVVVSITPEHTRSSAFKEQLDGYRDRVRFDTSIPPVRSTIGLNPKFVCRHPVAGLKSLGALYQLRKNLVAAVWREQPDCLIVTTADLQNLLLGAGQGFGQSAFPRHTRTIGLFHYGYAGSAETMGDRVKASVYRTLWKISPFDHLLFVNPLVYEWILSHDSRLRSRVGLVPDPVSPLSFFEQSEARHLLALPLEGRYVGFIGAMDHRVAIPELITAFRMVASNNDKLLLAGKLLNSYRTYIASHHGDLVQKQQLILRDRHLSFTELSAGYHALNLATPLYYKKPNLSANLLKALMANCPVLVSDFGYTHMMVQRFRIGWDCDASNPADIADKMRQALNSNIDYSRPAIEKLKQFHCPKNYAAAVMRAMQPTPSSAKEATDRSWQWVSSPEQAIADTN